MTAPFRAGAAAGSVSPLPEHLDDGVFLGGYGYYGSRRATGVHDDICCRALALGDGDRTLLILALDMVGLSPRRMLEARRAVAAGGRLPLDRVLVACTHSHASPDAQGLWGGVPEGYHSYLRDRCVQIAQEALSGLEEARLEAATAAAEGFALNRRGWDHTDTALTVLRARRRDGSNIATLVNFACHPVVTQAENVLISRDFPAGLVAALEEELGGVALFLNGAQGDANPIVSGGFAEAEEMGRRLAGAAVEALASGAPLEPPMGVRQRRLEIRLETTRLPAPAQRLLPFALPAVRLAASRGLLHRLSALLAARGRAELATVLAGVGMFAEGNRVPGRELRIATQIARIGIGEALQGLAAPGEVMTRLALPLRASMPGPHRLFLGLANDTLGYFLPEDEWMSGRNNSYEESVSLGREAGTALAAALRALIEEE